LATFVPPSAAGYDKGVDMEGTSN